MSNNDIVKTPPSSSPSSGFPTSASAASAPSSNDTSTTTTANSFLDSLMQVPGEELSSLLMAYDASWVDLDDDEEGNDQNDDDDDDNDDNKQQKRPHEATSSAAFKPRKEGAVTFDLEKTEIAVFSSTEFEAAQKHADDFFKTHDDDFLEQAARKFESFEYEILEEIGKHEGGGEDDDNGNRNHRNDEVKQNGQEQEREQEQEEGDGMMGQQSRSIFDSFTRTNSDIGADSDDWILEKISLSRKVPRSVVPDHNEDDCELEGDGCFDDYDENGNGKILTKRHQGSRLVVVQYLCHWKDYAEPTWETRAVLEKYGFSDDVIKFEQLELEKLKERQNIARAVGGKAIDPFAKYGFGGAKSSYRKTVFEEIFPDWQEFIVDKCLQSGLTVRAIANVAPSYAAAEMLRHWKSCREKSGEVKNPIRVFHGTRSPYVPAICKNSLAVPGTRGCSIVNANAFGLSIYTSTGTSTPACYSDSSCFMFCCVALVGKQYETVAPNSPRKPPSHFVLIRENRLIVPVWLIHFDRPQSYHSNRHGTRIVTDKERQRSAVKQSIRLCGTWQELVMLAANAKSLASPENEPAEYIPQNDAKAIEELNPRIASLKNDPSKKALKQFIRHRVGSKFIEHRSTKMMRQLPKAMKELVMESFKK